MPFSFITINFVTKTFTSPRLRDRGLYSVALQRSILSHVYSLLFIQFVIHTVCEEIMLRGGYVNYTHGQFVGSMATYRCNDDVCALNGSTNTRTCGDTGWTSMDLACECTLN